MQFENTQAFARQLDAEDPLKNFRDAFIIPSGKEGRQIYFLGNSLGLQPKLAQEYMSRIMEDWAQLGVEGFFHAREPWMDYHDFFTATLAEIVGARAEEVVVMNQLTVNLHLLLISFYRPDRKRFRIICEAKAFPSDQYVFETHVRHHGYHPQEAVIELTPRPGEHTLRTEDIVNVIKDHRDEVALVLLGGINYYSGQLFDIAAITKSAHEAGAVAGFDLAHAAGNVELKLHEWNVDFACWCSYKYLNSGPGAIGAAFIHEKHHNAGIPRFAGWWGYDKATRFKMAKGFIPMDGAEGWQLSTPSLLLYACHRASLDIFKQAGWKNILVKNRRLNAYLWAILTEVKQLDKRDRMEIITPEESTERGCQVSLLFKEDGRKVYDGLFEKGVMVDWREPNVIRLAPVALYNTFEEIWKFGMILKEVLTR